MDFSSDSADPKSKAPVSRGARACTTCRAAKMKCVGANDGEKQCQRCKRANVECVFEKHRRGRKPGSKLSEASKMLRKLEKGLNSAKSKAPTADTLVTSGFSDRGDTKYSYPSRPGDQPFSSSSSHFSSTDLAPLNSPQYSNGAAGFRSPNGRDADFEDDDEDNDRNDGGLFPAKMIRRESQRNEYFRTVLNSTNESANSSVSQPNGHNSSTGMSKLSPPLFTSPIEDPISLNYVDLEESKVLFDLIFLRLNPFINLFDPSLHTVDYVRTKSSFLFTTLIMAGCKFFKPERFKQCQRLAHELAVRAFAEGLKSVEVVQAFACLTYWKDPDDTRTWTYIGYACRMAVDLGLNRVLHHPPVHETELQTLERRNAERTYLVLFTHDRSLSTQTGKNWMLLDDEFTQRSAKWHEQGPSLRPEDVIISAFVQLRRINAEATDMFHSYKDGALDVNYDVALRNCNSKLSAWSDNWEREMKRAGGEAFHLSFLNLFLLHVKLFLNSFGLRAAMSSSANREGPSLHALSACCMSAMESLKILSKDFASISMLRYGQDSVTVMSAYSAVFLLRLLRNPITLPLLHNGTPGEIHSLIAKTADAYQDASVLSPASSSAAYHARFLRLLLENDVFNPRRSDKVHYDQQQNMNFEPHSHGSPTSSQGHSPVYPTPVSTTQSYPFSTSPTAPTQQPSRESYNNGINVQPVRNGTNIMGPPNYPQGAIPTAPPQASELDLIYWKNTFIELGFGGSEESAHFQNQNYPGNVPYEQQAQMYQQPHHQGGMPYQGPPQAGYIR